MNNLIDVSKLNPIEMQMLQEDLTVQRMAVFQRQIENLLSEQDKIKEEIKEIKADSVKQLEVTVNSMRVKEPKFNFVNQGDFGRFFSISISSVRIGKLLKVVGIAMKDRSSTTPYRTFVPNYAMPEANEKYTAVKWHYEKCLDHIDKWLRKNGYYESFYSCKTTRDLEKFIDSLYENI